MNVKESTLNIRAIGLLNARSRHVASTDPSEHTGRNCKTLLPPDQRPGILVICLVYSATAH